jgi:hypothetical protein
MHESIRNTIKRLRNFIRGALESPIVARLYANVRPIPSEQADPSADPGRDFSRIATRVLTPSGIVLNGVRYQSQSASQLLLYTRSRSKSAGIKVTVKFDPSDVTNIKILDHAAFPHPRWITMPIASSTDRHALSFRHQMTIPHLSRPQKLTFSTEQQRLGTYERLRQAWEEVAKFSGESQPSSGNIGISTDQFDDDYNPISRPPVKRRRERKPTRSTIAKSNPTKEHKKIDTTTSG